MIPQGFCDLNAKIKYNKKLVTERFLSAFGAFSYKNIETSILEDYNSYASQPTAFRAAELFKINDLDGNLYVLRPSYKSAVSRYVSVSGLSAATPLRLCFDGQVYNAIGDKREKTVAGACICAINDCLAEAEMITVAIEGLLAAGLKNLRVNVGHADALNGAFFESKVPAESEAAMRRAFKENGNIDDFAKSYPLPCAISLLRGGVEVLNEAEGVTNNAMTTEAVLALYELYYMLLEYKLPVEVRFDLGLQSKNGSKNIFFNIEAEGKILVEGERDNGALARYNVPFSGFVYAEADIEELYFALSKQGKISAEPQADILIGTASSITSQGGAVGYARSLTEKGFSVELIYNSNKAFLQEYAQSKGTENIIFINEAGKPEGL